MRCNASPAPEDFELLAYLDGETTAEVQAHVAACPTCQARVSRLAEEERGLRSRLSRAACPDPFTLGEYHLGHLAALAAASVAAHLEWCPLCRAEQTQLQDYLATLEATSPIGDRVASAFRTVVAHISGHARPGHAGGLPLAPALRGAGAEPVVFEAEDILVALETHSDAGDPGARRIAGLLSGLPENTPPGSVAGDETASPATGSDVTLWSGDEPVAAVPIDDLGSFILTSVRPGHYDLTLTLPVASLEVRIEGLDVE